MNKRQFKKFLKHNSYKCNVHKYCTHVYNNESMLKKLSDEITVCRLCKSKFIINI